MVRAIIKSMECPDIPDMENYQPETDAFMFLLTLMVGPDNGNGAESFDLQVCTPQWLMENHAKSDVLFLRHRLIVFEFSYERIINAIRKRVECITGKDWTEVANQVNEIAHWEFDGFLNQGLLKN